MIPILYESNETEFRSNGLGRLRDCIDCVVTEERNGIYECDFTYPINGSNYDRIKLGRIIAVEHDDTNDVQPFDIVSCTRPIDGKVTFHATHISYRMSKMVANGSNINSLASAFNMLKNASPSNPFTYESDQPDSGYMAAADGVPKTVRQFLGGVEGSILDTYRGEYEWDKFRVILHSNRGTAKDFTIRYGVDLTDYNEELDYSESYSSVIPYWTGSDVTVVGSKVTATGASYNGRDECVPLDLSDKFEPQPTTAQLQTYAQSYVNSSNALLPKQNITVKFVRLTDSIEYQALTNLFKCQLCDTIKVAFPRYNMTGRFKIVKTVYDVLQERFTEMELGTLSTTLAEALGVSNSLGSSSNGSEQEQIESTVVSFDLTTGSAVARYAPDTTSNLGTAVVDLSTLSALSGKEILIAVPVDAVRNSGQDRAFLEVSKTQARIWGRPSQTYSCRVQVLYR
ncbi:MAG: phage tail protein [Clostridiales bacterium]|nr:phage tail protein [Clostridiales bacterium]